MLDGLDAVDWGSLHGCYRSAGEAPQHIRAMLSPSQEVREWGSSELIKAVYHQGTVYELSAVVVPFLYELLESDGVPDKGTIAEIIAIVADGHSFLECHARTPESAATWEAILAKEGKSLAVESAREQMYVAAAKRAVLAKLDVLYPYISDPEPEVRAAIAQAMGCFPDVAARLLPDLEAALRDEPHEYPRSVLEAVVVRVRKAMSVPGL